MLDQLLLHVPLLLPSDARDAILLIQREDIFLALITQNRRITVYLPKLLVEDIAG